MKKVVFVNRFYSPDNSATSQILTDLAVNLATELSVCVITGRNFYSGSKERLVPREELNGVNVYRVWTTNFGRSNLIGRGFDYLTFYLSSFLMMLVLVKRADVLVAKTDPPLISVFAALAALIKRATLINWLQDVFPEVALELNVKLVSFRPIFVVLRTLRNWSLKIAVKNVVLGEVMGGRIAKELQSDTSIEVIPNWVVGDVKPVPKEQNPLVKQWSLEGKFVVGYSGNLGRAHDYETMLLAAQKLQIDEGIVFLFIGGGAGYDILKAKAQELKLKNVLFKPYQALDELSCSLSVADVHLICLEKSMEGLIVPSKFYGVLAAAKPIIFIGDTGGEIGSIVNRSGLGFVTAVGDPDGLYDGIIKLEKNRKLLNEFQANASRLYAENYSPGRSYDLWMEIFEPYVCSA